MITLSISTSKRNELIDITGKIKEKIREYGWNTGVLTVYCPHTTAGITINENADPSVRTDIINTLAKLIPEYGDYAHTEGNSDAHLKSSLVGASAQVIVQAGQMMLGTWQGIYFCEFDGPRRRQVYLHFQPD